MDNASLDREVRSPNRNLMFTPCSNSQGQLSPELSRSSSGPLKNRSQRNTLRVIEMNVKMEQPFGKFSEMEASKFLVVLR